MRTVIGIAEAFEELKKGAAKKMQTKRRQIQLAENIWKPLYAAVEKRYKEALQEIGAVDGRSSLQTNSTKSGPNNPSLPANILLRSSLPAR